MTDPKFPETDGAAAGRVIKLMLDGPAGAIEAVGDTPEADVAPLDVVAVFCHPLSTEGGSLDNKVVTMACRALRELGASTVRFNFRSVGASAGEFDNGQGEGDDLRAVVDWVRRVRPGCTLWLGGFSFGAYVSLRMAAELAPALLISVAPPAGRHWDFEHMPLYAGPWLVIQGDADEIVDAQRVYRWVEQVSEHRAPPTLVKIPDTSHFFHGKLMDLRGAVRNGARELVGMLPAAALQAAGASASALPSAVVSEAEAEGEPLASPPVAASARDAQGDAVSVSPPGSAAEVATQMVDASVLDASAEPVTSQGDPTHASLASPELPGSSASPVTSATATDATDAATSAALNEPVEAHTPRADG